MKRKSLHVNSRRARRLGAVTSLAGCAGLVAVLALPASAVATGCTATGFVRDGTNLTAAMINPAGTVSGTVNAAGCNIGVYYGPTHKGTVKHALVENSNYFGVVNNGGKVTVTNSTVTKIGETPLNGAQHGVGIYFAVEGHSTGSITENTVSVYQKGGIEVNGVGSSATISGNTVIGQGAVPYIAQNGIEVGYGAGGSVKDNFVYGNAYSGTNNASSAGILVFGGPVYGTGVAYTTGIDVEHNTLINNDMGIAFYNAGANGLAPPTATHNTADSNTISDSLTTNISGNGYPNGYQAGVSDFGNRDSIINNKIYGIGYNQSFAPTPGSLYTHIDTTGSIKPYVHGNR